LSETLNTASFNKGTFAVVFSSLAAYPCFFLFSTSYDLFVSIITGGSYRFVPSVCTTSFHFPEGKFPVVLSIKFVLLILIILTGYFYSKRLKNSSLLVQVGSDLLINFGQIFIIGLLLFGYDFYFQSHTPDYFHTPNFGYFADLDFFALSDFYTGFPILFPFFLAFIGVFFWYKKQRPLSFLGINLVGLIVGFLLTHLLFVPLVLALLNV
jgi:hypothetical protein